MLKYITDSHNFGHSRDPANALGGRLTHTNSKLELELPKPTSPNFNALDAAGYNSNFSSETFTEL